MFEACNLHIRPITLVFATILVFSISVLVQNAFADGLSAPNGLTATAISYSRINLSWTAPSDNGGSAINGYKIERSQDGGTSWSTIFANTSSTNTIYSDSGLTPSTTYIYRVSAINSIGTSSPSNTTSATTLANTGVSNVNCDLTGPYVDLSGCNFAGTDMSGTILPKADLTNTNFVGADLHNARLDGANLSTANLHNSNLGGANLHNANLTNADLNGANLGYANLSGADLSDSNLSGANLSYVNLSGSNLSGANLSDMYLGRAYANPPCTGNPICSTLSTSRAPSFTTLNLLPHSVPAEITYDPSTGTVYVANAGDHTISVIDGSTNKIIDTIILDKPSSNFSYPGPVGLVFDPKNNYLYAANSPDGTVSIINVKTLNIVDTVHIGGYLTWLAINLHSQEVYVHDGSTIYILSTQSHKIIGTIHADDPLGFAYNPDDGNLYATNYVGNSISVFNGKTHELTHTITGGGLVFPQFIAFDSHNKRAYVTCNDYKSVVVIDTKEEMVIQKITLPDRGGYFAQPYNLVFDPDNEYMYVDSISTGGQYIIDTNSMKVVGFIHAYSPGYGVSYNLKNKTIYVHDPYYLVSLLRTDTQ